MSRKKVIILGAAGRDFHNFNCRFRGNEDYEVVAFTATQIPHIVKVMTALTLEIPEHIVVTEFCQFNCVINAAF